MEPTFDKQRIGADAELQCWVSHQIAAALADIEKLDATIMEVSAIQTELNDLINGLCHGLDYQKVKSVHDQQAEITQMLISAALQKSHLEGRVSVLKELGIKDAIANHGNG